MKHLFLKFKHCKYKIAQAGQKGFTLIEVIIAIFILSIGIAGSMTLMTSSLKDSYIAEDSTTAIYLANEGIEAVRTVRDSNALLKECNNQSHGTACATLPSSWDSISASLKLTACTTSDPCVVDATLYPPSIKKQSDCPGGVGTKVVKDVTGNFRQCMTGGTQTQFTRTIEATSEGTGGEDLVTSTVSWKDNTGASHSESVTESIFDISGYTL